MEGITLDSDYAYIGTFIIYLNAIINIIINLFSKLGGGSKTEAPAETPADGE